MHSRDWHGYGYPWISADIHLTRGYGWIWMKPPNIRMDMDGWSSSRFGYGWIWICLPLWIGLDWMDIPIFDSVYNYKAKGIEDAFKFQCLPANRNLFPPLGNLTPQEAESELKLQLSRVRLPSAWTRTYCICEYQCFPYQCLPPCC